MGFEIITSTTDTDLTVVFDQENAMYVSGKQLHAYKGTTKEEIRKIYQDILNLAAEQSIESLEVVIMHHTGIAEIHIYPIVIQEINAFFEKHELNIFLNLETTSFYYISKPQVERVLFTEMQEFLEKTPLFQPMTPVHYDQPQHINPQISPSLSSFGADFYLEKELDTMLNKKKKSVTFGERLIQLIDEKGYAKDSLVYNKAMIDRRLYHNIISKKDYLPKKNTVILLALALELNEEESKDFLSYAGYSFSDSFKDQIILYCIRNNYYNIMYINAYLYDKALAPLLTID